MSNTMTISIAEDYNSEGLEIELKAVGATLLDVALGVNEFRDGKIFRKPPIAIIQVDEAKQDEIQSVIDDHTPEVTDMDERGSVEREEIRRVIGLLWKYPELLNELRQTLEGDIRNEKS